MFRSTKATCLIFLVVLSVYSGRADEANSAGPANPSDRVSVEPAKPSAPTTHRVISVTGGAVANPNPESRVHLLAEDPVTAPPPTTAPAEPHARPVAPGQVNVSEAGTVEIHVSDASLGEVLRMLSLQSQTNILPSKEVRGTVTANLYDVTVKEALDAILRANGCTFREKGNIIYVYTNKEAEEILKAERVLQTEVFHLCYTSAADAQNLIKPILSSDGKVAMTNAAVTGLVPVPTDPGGNAHANEDMLVVTDTPETIEKVRKAIKSIDRRPQQLLVEATILRASLTEDNALGIDFTVLGGVNFSAITGAPNTSAGQATTGGLVDTTTKKGIAGYTAGGTSFTAGMPSGGLHIGIVYDNIAAFITALEEVSDTVVLANPKVLVLNKQKGEVKVARMDPYRGRTIVNTNGMSEQDIEFLETGTKLVFRPYIAEDGYIRIDIHPEDSSPLEARSADLPPTKLTTETTTNVLVKDGHTIVIGGMFRESTQVSRSQVPGLGNIPLLGNLFKKQQDSTVREEVIVLLTPHIIKDDSAYSKASEAEMKEAEKLRVGVRRGMMVFGRERLAEGSYEKAQEELNKPLPDRQKALWYLDCATNLNPKFREAIDLKEQITGKTISSVDNSSIRGFVARQILMEKMNAAATQPTAIALPARATTRPAMTSAKIAAPTTKPAAQANGMPQANKPMALQADAEDMALWEALWTDAGADNQPKSAAGAPAVAKPVEIAVEKPAVAARPRAATRPIVTIMEMPAEDLHVDLKDVSGKSDK